MRDLNEFQAFLVNGERGLVSQDLRDSCFHPGAMGDWHYAGSNPVTDSGKVRLPERLFEEGILASNRVAYWAFERGQGFLLVSNQPLDEKDRYKPQGSSPIGSEEKGYLTNIPKVFFEDFEGRGKGEGKTPVPEHARVDYDEKRFFAFREDMAEGDTRSCYLFTWKEFDNTIGDDDWAEPLDEIPRFS